LVLAALLPGGMSYSGMSSPPAGYREWKVVTVAHEEGTLNDLRAVLGNDIAIKAFRDGQRPFPDGTIIARVAWRYVSSPQNDAVFGRAQSFVAGEPVNGLQFMVKDSRKYAATGGWRFAQFNGGRPLDGAGLASCFVCHRQIAAQDLVFSRYSP
jgi:hypothetical protein